MSTKRLIFYAAKKDLHELITQLEAGCDIAYAEIKHYPSKEIALLPTLLNPDLGNARHPDFAANPHYLVFQGIKNIEGTKIQNRDQYYISNQPESVVFTPGGEHGGEYIIRGEVVTNSDTEVSRIVFKKLSSTIKKQFPKIGPQCIGIEALRLYQSGWRLVHCAGRDPIYDLQLREPNSKPHDLKRKPRHSYRTSCQFLMENGWEFGCDFLVELGWNGEDEPPMPQCMPLPDDEEPCGVSFFKTAVCGEPDDLESLENLSLPRTFICRSEVSYISFANTDLSESFLCWNDFVNADFTNADLSRADLRSSRLNGVNFGGANLSNADFRHSEFQSCSFSGAKLAGCKLSAKLTHQLKLTAKQIADIDWCMEEGAMPPGG